MHAHRTLACQSTASPDMLRQLEAKRPDLQVQCLRWPGGPYLMSEVREEKGMITDHSDEPSSDEQRIVATLQHAREPVERRVRVSSSNGLVQRRDGVVVVV